MGQKDDRPRRGNSWCLAAMMIGLSLLAGCTAAAWFGSRDARLATALELSTILSKAQPDGLAETLWDMLHSEDKSKRSEAFTEFNQLGWWVPHLDEGELAAFEAERGIVYKPPEKEEPDDSADTVLQGSKPDGP